MQCLQCSLVGVKKLCFVCISIFAIWFKNQYFRYRQQLIIIRLSFSNDHMTGDDRDLEVTYVTLMNIRGTFLRCHHQGRGEGFCPGDNVIPAG